MKTILSFNRLFGRQVATLRERLLKLGAHVVASVRRIVLHLPASYPWMKDWQRLAQALGASPG